MTIFDARSNSLKFTLILFPHLLPDRLQWSFSSDFSTKICTHFSSVL